MAVADDDLERLMEGVARAGVTMLLKTDHERMADQTRPWTILLSGPAFGEARGFRTDQPSLAHCLRHGLAALRALPGDWDWLDEFPW